MWEPEFVDKFLELVLPCADKTDFERQCASFFVLLGSTRKKGIDEGVQYLRRKADGRNPYAGATEVRSRRDNLPWTWVEQQILIWSFEKKYTETVLQPTVPYVAELLQRTEEEVEKRRNQKHGITGFDL